MAKKLDRDQLIKELQQRVDFYTELIDRMPANRVVLIEKKEPLEDMRNYLLTNYLTLTDADLQKANTLLNSDDGMDVTAAGIGMGNNNWIAALAIATIVGFGVYYYYKHKKA